MLDGNTIMWLLICRPFEKVGCSWQKFHISVFFMYFPSTDESIILFYYIAGGGDCGCIFITNMLKQFVVFFPNDAFPLIAKFSSFFSFLPWKL